MSDTVNPEDSNSRIERILCLSQDRLDVGETVSIEEIARQHPDLMPELGDRLREVFTAYQATRSTEETANSSDETISLSALGTRETF
jgi:hypothetical protein